jgi:hypothetical protein
LRVVVTATDSSGSTSATSGTVEGQVAAIPTAVLGAVTSLSPTSATLNAAITSNGAEAETHFEYRYAASSDAPTQT